MHPAYRKSQVAVLEKVQDDHVPYLLEGPSSVIDAVEQRLADQAFRARGVQVNAVDTVCARRIHIRFPAEDSRSSRAGLHVVRDMMQDLGYSQVNECTCRAPSTQTEVIRYMFHEA
ncbi:Uncharacterized protein PBTT_02379 [Plasmodiophora brassicae]|nr:hypothetical protein PBRA_008006 [Plasmodiophora brassicae]